MKTIIITTAFILLQHMIWTGQFMPDSNAQSARLATIQSSPMNIRGTLKERPNSLQVLLADQQQESQPGLESSASEEKAAAESEKNTESGKPPAKTQKKNSSKPFRPSERIKADQAVDFPSDI